MPKKAPKTNPDWSSAGFNSSNGHVVRHYGRGFFIVSSFSRPGHVIHFVDFEPNGNWPIVCTCESFTYGLRRPCRHQIAAVQCMLAPLELPHDAEEAMIEKILGLLIRGVPVAALPYPKVSKKRQYLLRNETNRSADKRRLLEGVPSLTDGNQNRDRPGLPKPAKRARSPRKKRDA